MNTDCSSFYYDEHRINCSRLINFAGQRHAQVL